MKGLKLAASLIGLFITLPIWYFIVYRILCAIAPGELVWFLFWIYIPLGLFVKFITEVIGKSE